MKEAAQAQQESAELEKRAKQLGLVPTKLDPKTREVTYGLPKPELFGEAPPPNTSTLPPTKTQATKPSQQPREGNRVRQNGVTYEYRNGSYIQVD
jgi:hypothetical protein